MKYQSSLLIWLFLSICQVSLAQNSHHLEVGYGISSPFGVYTNTLNDNTEEPLTYADFGTTFSINYEYKLQKLPSILFGYSNSNQSFNIEDFNRDPQINFSSITTSDEDYELKSFFLGIRFYMREVIFITSSIHQFNYSYPETNVSSHNGLVSYQTSYEDVRMLGLSAGLGFILPFHEKLKGTLKFEHFRTAASIEGQSTSLDFGDVLYTTECYQKIRLVNTSFGLNYQF